MNYRKQLQEAVGAVYAEADKELEALQLDLLKPEEAPHSVRDVERLRAAAARERSREALRKSAEILGTAYRARIQAVTEFINTFGAALRGELPRR